MKKLLLSSFVVLTFIIYSLQQRHEGSVSVISPPSTQGGQSTTTGKVNQPQTTYKDGVYVGDPADAYYGNIQVQVTIKSGKITDVQFLQYPNDHPNSVRINQIAMPYLKQEAIKAQSSHVDIISGATDTSSAFIQSLATALAKA